MHYQKIVFHLAVASRNVFPKKYIGMVSTTAMSKYRPAKVPNKRSKPNLPSHGRMAHENPKEIMFLYAMKATPVYWRFINNLGVVLDQLYPHDLDDATTNSTELACGFPSSVFVCPS